MSVDMGDLKDAIEAAIKDGFTAAVAEIRPDVSPTPSPSDDPPAPGRIEITTDGGEDEDTLNGRLNTVSSNFTGLLGSVGEGLSQTIQIGIDGIAKFNKELDDEVSYFRSVQKEYGGISEAAYAAGEAVEGLAGQALHSFQQVGLAAAGGTDSLVTLQTSAMKGKNLLVEAFKDPAEAAIKFSEVLADVAADNTNLARSLEAQGDAEAQRIALLRKRMGITSGEMGDLLRREYAFTGEASADILQEIATTSVAVAKATGGSAKDLKDDIVEIIQDVNKFGDIGVDAAGRIAGALNQLGLDFQTFQNMTNQFMNFDSAAQKMGDLSALFGIQMDAMEMTYLANEDQEEFLFRMREEILDAGLDVENMSKTRQRALKDQLGLQSVEQLQQLMRGEELRVDQAGLEAATQSAETMDGMATAVEKFGGAFEGAYRGTAEFEKSLRMQATFTDEIARNIISIRKESGELPGKALGEIKLSEEAIQNSIVLLQKQSDVVQNNVAKAVTEIAKLANFTATATAGAINSALPEAKDLGGSVGGGNTSNTSPPTPTPSTATEVQSSYSTGEGALLNPSNNNDVVVNSVNDLITALNNNQNVNVKLELDTSVLGNKIFNVMQEENGGTIVFQPAN